jgi:hypothetical protein
MRLQYAVDYLKIQGCRDVPYIQVLGTSILREAINTVRDREKATPEMLDLACAVEMKVLKAEHKI